MIEETDGVNTESIYDLVMLCRALHAKIRNVEVTEDCDLRPHNPERFEVRCRKEPQHKDFEASRIALKE